nr:uncharacterized protein LOC107382249 isoform X1 [Nothobranchius furzeri]XP_054607660.1 uncharacterized protein LOC107382249 isoform X1 [Nothobranchius furzeri]XP_054607661.1 uncharacterized protein LOC107382249 isoform X1 [Nothobranchius furzeri]
MSQECLRIVREMANMQGRDVFVADLHVTRTWLPPTNGDPLLHFPKDAIIIPLWIPGQEHYTIYTTLYYSSNYTAASCFGRLLMPFPAKLQPVSYSRADVAQQTAVGTWTETTALDLEGVPEQTHGNDCGVFMIMDDTCLLGRWWCIVLLENLGLEGFGRKFAHFTEEGQATLGTNVPPVFRIKRKHESSTMVSEDLTPACLKIGHHFQGWKDSETAVVPQLSVVVLSFSNVFWLCQACR